MFDSNVLHIAEFMTVAKSLPHLWQKVRKLLIPKLFLSYSCILEEKSIVTVNFIDYLTGRPIASCRGAYTTLGFSVSADIRSAIKRVAKQIAETFP